MDFPEKIWSPTIIVYSPAPCGAGALAHEKGTRPETHSEKRFGEHGHSLTWNPAVPNSESAMGTCLSASIFELQFLAMIIGSHMLLYSDHPEADRAFFRDVLNFPAVDAGGGWLIFALPPAEAGIHPTEADTDRRQFHGGRHLLGAVLYLMCDDLLSIIDSLQAKNITCSSVEEEPWGIHTSIILPSGSEIGLYQPKHPLAIKERDRLLCKRKRTGPMHI
jgi:hypothetical protein